MLLPTLLSLVELTKKKRERERERKRESISKKISVIVLTMEGNFSMEIASF